MTVLFKSELTAKVFSDLFQTENIELQTQHHKYARPLVGHLHSVDTNITLNGAFVRFEL